MHDVEVFTVTSYPTIHQFKEAVLDPIPSVLKIVYMDGGENKTLTGTIHESVEELPGGGWIAEGEDRWIRDIHEGYRNYRLEVSPNGDALLYIEPPVTYDCIRF